MSETAIPPSASPEAARPSLGELTAASFKIGCLSFGGPAGQIALMHRIFVEEKKWISEERYMHALNYCMLLPGPEAQQLATYVGWLLHGVRGGTIAGALFVLPGALVVFALAWLYMAAGGEPLVAAAFFGVKAAVVALVAEAMIRIGKRALKGKLAVPIALITFLALYLWGVSFPILILGAGLVGAALALSGKAAGEPMVAAADKAPPAWRALASGGVWMAAWLAPVGISLLVLGGDHVLSRVGVLFSILAVVTFGGAYATLAYLREQAVEVEGWLTAGQMIDGLGLAETTPGPLVLVNEFVGFVAGWQVGGLVLAALCAAMAAWCTFAPSFMWIFGGAPFAERLRTNRIANGALKAITAAVLGVIAQLAIWFTLHVLFGEVGAVALPLGASMSFPRLETFDPVAAMLCVGACIALFRLHVGVLTLVLGSALAGVLLVLSGLA
jgi:chromate transporter